MERRIESTNFAFARFDYFYDYGGIPVRIVGRIVVNVVGSIDGNSTMIQRRQ